MEEPLITQIIKNKFKEVGNPAEVPLIRGKGTFNAKLVDDGIIVSNLRWKKPLSWDVFIEAVYIILKNGGSAIKGNAMKSRLGGQFLPFNSKELLQSHAY
jgi:hypothetical protein